MASTTTCRPETTIDSAVEAFGQVIQDLGLLPNKIEPNGRIKRCGTVTHPKSKNGWYVMYTDPFAGAYGDWASNMNGKWTMAGTTLSAADHERLRTEINRQRQKREAAEAKKYEVAASLACQYLDDLNPAISENFYLTRKKVKPAPGLKEDNDILVVPVHSPDSGQPMSYQRINAAGDKKNMPNGQMSGGYFFIPGNDGPLILVEGIATGLSINMATGKSVLVAFFAHNLTAVARMARDRYPNREIIIAADNDVTTDAKHGKNPGVKAANAAALAIGGKVAIPDHEGDWNDVHVSLGLEAVRVGIEAAQTLVTPSSNDTGGVEIDWEHPILFDDINVPPIDPKYVPEPIRSYCIALSESVQVPFDLAFCAALGALAAAAQGKYIIVVKGGYTEPLCIYLVAVLPPAERKSSTLEKAKAPLLRWELEQAAKTAPLIKEIRSERLTREKAIATIRAKAGNPKNEIIEIVRQVQELENSLPEIPIPKRLFVDDVTPEGLVDFMEKQGGCAAILEAEGGIFELMSGLYTKGNANLNVWLKPWSREKITVDRKSKDTIHIDNPALSMVLLPQPDVIRDIGSKEGFRGRGLLGRFLYCFPHSRLGQRIIETPPIPAQCSIAYESMLLNIVESSWATDDNGNETHHEIRLSDDAYQLWGEFAKNVEGELGEGGEFHNMTDWAGKLPGQAIRIAGLYHVAQVNNPATEPISEETMEMALGLAASLTGHAQHAFRHMGADLAVECAKKILKWITDQHIKIFTARDAFNVVRGDSRFSKMALVSPGIKELEDRCYIRRVNSGEKTGPGRKPSSKYEVNPLTHNEHKPQN